MILVLSACGKKTAEKVEAQPKSMASKKPNSATYPKKESIVPQPQETPSKPPTESSNTREAPPLLSERVDGIALVRLPVEGFSSMSLREKLLTYHLYQASLAGRDITYDQGHRLALDLRHNLEQVLTHGEGLEAELMDRITRYTKLVWISNGPYHERTKRKLQVSFTPKEWERALSRAVKNGANLKLEEEKDIAKLMFDPDWEPISTAKSPPPGQDILTASANNLYSDVSLADLTGFEEQFPLNSRLVKRDGVLVEEVYRAGRKPLAGKRPSPTGRYHVQLKAVADHLRAALDYSSEQQRKTLEELIDWFETGDLSSFDRSNIAWLRDNPTVDLILGFIETYKDARGVKGEWEGIVSVIDERATRLMMGVADNAQYFEDRSPWDNQYKKQGIKVPVAKAIQVIVGHGGSGPSLPAGVNLPNSQSIREQYGSKSFLLTNVMRAIDGAVRGASLNEFALPEERAGASHYGSLIGDIEVALHEIVGHGSGKLSEKLQGKDPAVYLKEHANALEECRAELVALHHIWDPRMREIESDCTDACAEAAYRGYARQDLTMLRRVLGDRIEDDHMRATHVIVQYAVSKGAVRLEQHNGSYFNVVKDIALMRQAVAELLTEVMRIKAEGDYSAAKKLFETYGMFFDTNVRDQIVLRARKAGVPSFYAFIMPELRLMHDDAGEVIDVVLEEQGDFKAQMLRWSASAAR